MLAPCPLVVAAALHTELGALLQRGIAQLALTLEQPVATGFTEITSTTGCAAMWTRDASTALRAPARARRPHLLALRACAAFRQGIRYAVCRSLCRHRRGRCCWRRSLHLLGCCDGLLQGCHCGTRVHGREPKSKHGEYTEGHRRHKAIWLRRQPPAACMHRCTAAPHAVGRPGKKWQPLACPACIAGAIATAGRRGPLHLRLRKARIEKICGPFVHPDTEQALAQPAHDHLLSISCHHHVHGF